ncbi:MFS transporter [Sphaerisporangium rufum]|uniref:MFS transporter n=1 Tax=Sphaerisporangium rufum TaxID=1381558 RepID=A0A919V2R1_9ACTN|nr:DHA2 family efflux MFS transporter permease subunit [Sphaerisporangium rufum]GII79962.1 MFS transporter [Sphaerisporangium rufum]
MREVATSSDTRAGPKKADKDRRRWWGLVFISLAVAMVIVDVTIINIAVPAIVSDLRVGSTTTQWIQEAYTLTLAALLLSSGRLADLFGRRRLLLAGILVFVVGSVVAAVAAGGAMLVGARVIQGIGGAAILPTTLSIINATFRGRERATAFAVWGSTIGAVAALGPLLGGWLVGHFSWHWAFWINVFLGAIVTAGIVRWVGESRDAEGPRGVDVLGVGLSALAVAALVFGLIEGRGEGWFTALGGDGVLGSGLSPVPMAFGLSLGALLCFARWQRRRRRLRRSVVLDVSLFKIKTFAQGNLVVMVVALGQLGLLFVLPLWLQNVLGYSPLRAGAMITAVAIGAFVAAGVTPALAPRWGVPAVLRIGLVAEIAAFAVLAVSATPDASAWAIVPALTLYGFGVGTADAQLPSLILSDVPAAGSGQAAGTQGTAQEIGSAMGVAILGTLLFSMLSFHLDERLADAGVAADRRGPISEAVVGSAGTVIPAIPDLPVRRAAEEAFSAATRDAALAGGIVIILGLISTSVFRRRPVPGDAGDGVRSDDAGPASGDQPDPPR